MIFDRAISTPYISIKESRKLMRVQAKIWHMEAISSLISIALDAWLVHYNIERPHLSYRILGRRPIETVMSFVRQEG